MNRIDYSYFEQINVQSLMCNYNVCSCDWGEENCCYGFCKLYYFIEGESTIIINENVYHPQPEELYLIPALTSHTYYHNPEKPVIQYWCHFDLNLGGDRRLVFTKDTLKCRIPKETVEPIFKNLITRDTSKKTFGRFEEKISLLSLLYIFLQNVDYTKLLTGDSNDFISKINHYIQEHIQEQITLNDLIGIMPLHPNYFIYYFKKHFNSTPMEYVMSIKLQEATKLLEGKKEICISTVAYNVGFKDYHYFARCFKRKFGITPSAYRTMHK